MGIAINDDSVEEEPPGALLRRFREERRLTQAELGMAAGVTGAAVSDWERGKSTPDRNHAQAADQKLTAGGAVLTAFGYTDARPENGGPATPMPAVPSEPTVADLAAKLDEILHVLDRMSGAIAALAPRQRSSPRSSRAEPSPADTRR